MSKQDSQFFNVFSVVIGLLVAAALILMAFARAVGANTQVQHVRSDPEYVAGVAERVKPFARVAVAGQDNSALVIDPPTGSADTGAGALAALPDDGQGVYEAVCTACHGAGIGGAPKADDRAAWAPRLAQGTATLYKHAIEGYTGKAGVMPAKGGRTDASDAQIQAAVDYMVSLAK
ncbi:MAG: c-type cytochrome [Steroidobacteraceae bacterium]|nr:c-type cytochrome [Steroidobacteraceae bacterium]